jgi:hypothetical protein
MELKLRAHEHVRVIKNSSDIDSALLEFGFHEHFILARRQTGDLGITMRLFRVVPKLGEVWYVWHESGFTRILAVYLADELEVTT